MISLPTIPVLSDACCLLNLYASGKFEDIASTLYKLSVADYIIQKEALFIRKQKSEAEFDEIEKVELEAFISSGLVTVMSINSETELQTYIDLASELDDGEAITISLAIHNGCLIATDDRKALRLISNIGSLTAVSTLELIKAWSEAKDINDAEVKQVLLNMYLCASYRPSERDPLYKWWQTMTKK